MRGVTHFNKVSGKYGLYVGPDGAEIEVVDADGNLKPGGTAQTQAAEANLSGGATLSDVISKVNAILAKLRAAKIIASS